MPFQPLGMGVAATDDAQLFTWYPSPQPHLPNEEKSNMPAPIVFFDIAGPDATSIRSFYSRLFGWNVAEDGRFNVTVESTLSGTIRQDPAEKRLYLGVDDVAAKLEEVQANGGTIDVPRFEVPGVVILGLFKDPAGNPMGLVEMLNGKPKVP